MRTSPLHKALSGHNRDPQPQSIPEMVVDPDSSSIEIEARRVSQTLLALLALLAAARHSPVAGSPWEGTPRAGTYAIPPLLVCCPRIDAKAVRRGLQRGDDKQRTAHHGCYDRRIGHNGPRRAPSAIF